MNLRQFDLNLLVALDVLLTERNVEVAAAVTLRDGIAAHAGTGYPSRLKV